MGREIQAASEAEDPHHEREVNREETTHDDTRSLSGSGGTCRCFCSAACFSPVIFFYRPTRVVTVLVPRAVPCATVLSVAKLVIETSFDLS